MINVTDIAAEKLKEVIAQQAKPEETMVRVSLNGYG